MFDPAFQEDSLTIAGVRYRSRLLVGTGKYRDLEQTRLAIEASGAEIVTVAIRRTNIGQDPSQANLLDVLPPSRYMLLPNTAGCYDAQSAIRTCRLARELLEGHT
ncbi:MAG: thiazole synthase, partial [Gammaproteobacteria bacterium]